MKAKNWSQYWIPLTVVACSLVLLAALTFALSGSRWSPVGRVLHIDFPDATGIRLHSPVRYAGATAGTVTQIRYLNSKERLKSPNPKNAVRVTVRLNKDVPDLPADLAAGLASETILGEKFISLSAGLPDSKPLADGAVIQGRGLVAFDSMAGTAEETIRNANRLLSRINQDYPQLLPRLTSLLGQVEGILLKGSNLVQNTDTAVSNAGAIVEELKKDYALLSQDIKLFAAQAAQLGTNGNLAVEKAAVVLERADQLIEKNEGDIQRLLAELRVTAQNLKVVSTYAKALTATLGRKPSRLIWGSRSQDLPTEEEILKSSEPVPIVK